MSVDSDEDVIFENSALHMHLQSAGVENVVTESYQTQQTRDETTATEKLPDRFTRKVKRKWAMDLWDCFSFFHLKATLRHLESVAKNQVCFKLRQCPTLEPDDINFLDEFIGPCIQPSNNGVKKLAGLIGFIVVITGVLCQRILITNLSFQRLFFSDPVVVIATCCLMMLIGCSMFLFVKQKKLDEQVQIFIEFLKNLEKFQALLKKSIRLIQESELVARGFTLMTNSGPLRGMERSSVRKTARQCPELRHRVFHASRNSMMYIRNATQLLIQKFYPMSPGQGTTHHFALIPLEEYGPFVHLKGNSDEERAQLLEATDNFSVAALKGMSNLWNLQQSEFVRCLAICFQSLSQWPATKPQAVSIQRIHNQVMSPPMSILEESLTTLQHCYEFHYASIAVKEDTRPVPANAENSELKGLYVAVHSLDLHLQSALRMSRSLASDIEKQMDKGNTVLNLPVEAGSDWLEQLERLKAELAACQDCWAEGQCQGERLFEKKTDLQTEIPESVLLNASAQAATKQVIQIVGDPVIEDDVFEVYVDDEDEDKNTVTWDEFLSPEEKARKKKEKEEAVRLLSELRTVISGLADERKKREDKILQAKTGYVARDDVSGDNSIPLTNPEEESCPETAPVARPTLDEPQCSLPGDSVTSQHDQDMTVEDLTPYIDHTRSPIQKSSPSSEQSSSLGVEHQEELSDRLEHLSGANLSFTASLAAQVVAKSRLLGLESETFGDDDSDDDIDDTNIEKDNDDIIDGADLLGSNVH